MAAKTINLATIGELLPKTFVSDVVETTRASSVVASLSPAEAMNFGTSNVLTLGDRPRAEFVGESQQKSATDISWGSFQITPKKAQVTVRLTNEVEWSNAQAQVDVIGKIKTESSAALTEALDLGVIHRLNPLTATEITTWEQYVNGTANRVERGKTEADADLRKAIRSLQGTNVNVNGLAMVGAFLADLADLQALSGGQPTGLPRYPGLGFATDVSSFQGLNAAVSPTVKGFGTDGTKLGTFEKPVQAIVGDWRNGIRWGVQKIIPAEVIPYGDPDGKGDLKRTNEFALRVEIVYGWHVDMTRFAVIENATPDA